MNRLRLAFARWLAPQTFADAERHRDMLATIEHERRWLSEFAEVKEALDRLVDPAPIDVAKFRDRPRGQQMRRTVLARRGIAF